MRLTCQSARLAMTTRSEADADRAALAEHLNACSACSAYLESQQALDQRLANTLVIEPPSWLTASILEQLNPEPVMPWWARPTANLALQWSFYILLTGGLILALLVPIDSVAFWAGMLLTAPQQFGLAVDVLMTVLGRVPLDPIMSALEDATWLYQAAALGLVFWWLSQAQSRQSRPQA
jgi:hypothetical protein